MNAALGCFEDWVPPQWPSTSSGTYKTPAHLCDGPNTTLPPEEMSISPLLAEFHTRGVASELLPGNEDGQLHSSLSLRCHQFSISPGEFAAKSNPSSVVTLLDLRLCQQKVKCI